MDGSPADLDAIAERYDPELHEAPVVVGHPASDAPAYGWVKRLAVRAARLVADIGEIDPAFAELVAAGRYRKVSAALYSPTSPSSPAPGAWYLRHLGFLGAQPPAVKGLRPVALAEGEQLVTIELGEPATGWALDELAALLGGLRDWLIEREGVERADQILPAWRIDGLRRLATEQTTAAPAAATSFAETTEERTMTERAAEDTATDLEQREADIAARDKELAERDARVAAREAALRRLELEGEAEALVAAGKVLPAEREAVIGLMATLDGAGTVELGEGQTAPAAMLRAFLAGLPVRVDFGERAPGGGGEPVDAGDPGALADAARAWQAEQASKGLTVDAATAVRRISRGAAA